MGGGGVLYSVKINAVKTLSDKAIRATFLITVQQDATYSVHYISVGSSTCFGCQHPKRVELPTEM